MLRSRVVLPVVSVYNAWQAEGLAELHRALITQIDFDTSSVAEGDLNSAVSLFQQGWAALERFGLARGREVHPDLGRSLRLVAEASTDYWAFFNHGDEPTRSALVSVAGDDAIRIILTADKQFIMEPVHPEDAAQALVAALPEVPPGKGQPISLPADALNQPRHQREEGDGFLQANRYATTPQEQQVAALRKLLAEPRVGGGQLYAARRDRFGKKVRCPTPLTFFDTVGGRYLQFQVSSSSGPWHTIQAADFTTMTSRLDMLPATIPTG